MFSDQCSMFSDYFVELCFKLRGTLCNYLIINYQFSIVNYLMKPRPFSRRRFDNFIRLYTPIELLNCFCAVLDRLLPEKSTPSDKKEIQSLVRKYFRARDRYYKKLIKNQNRLMP